MVNKKIKPAFLISVVLAVISCTNTVPNNVRSGSAPFPTQENFQDLDREYAFNTKELTQSYLKRKLEKWLDSGSESPNPDGLKLVKEIAYARYKHPQQFCEVITENPGILNLILEVDAVQARKAFDMTFSEFLESCPAPSHPEFRVSTYTSGHQQLTSVAMDADGDYIIAWESGIYNSPGPDGDDFGVFARRYNSAGETIGSEFQVNQFTTGYQGRPSVAMTDDGSFVITWTSKGQSAFYEIYARIYDNNGDPVGSEFKVNTDSASNKLNSRIAIDNDGEFAIAWQSDTQDSSSWGIYGQRFNSDGSRPAENGSEFRVNNYTTQRQINCSIAMDNDGDFVVSWESYLQDGDLYGAYFRRYSNSGDPLTDDDQPVTLYTTGHQWGSFTAMDSDGDFIVTWSDQYQGEDGFYGVFGRRYDSSGTPVSSEFLLNTYTDKEQTYPAVAMDDDGDFVTVWQSGDFYGDNDQDGDNYGVYAQRYNSAGERVGSELQVNSFTTGGQSNPVAAMDNNGDFVLSWQSFGQDYDGYGVYARRYDRKAP
jgi:hypothetical protein